MRDIAGKRPVKYSFLKYSRLFQDTSAYIPYAVIGIFIVLIATFTSVFLLKMDSEVAETIYTTEKSDPRQAAINLAASDLARCLNYAGMEALEWQGEHPVILPDGSPVERSSEDNFMATPQNQNLEKGDTLQISINLPSDVWGRIESLWKNRDVVLVVKDSAGQQLKSVNYGQATGFLQKVSFDEYMEVPENSKAGYASIELYYGDELKASDWFQIEASPLKDITAEAFNRLLSVNYQGNSHTFMEYAVNVEPDIEPEQIKVRKVNGTLQREISPSGKNYTIYYIFEIPVLNYTLVDLESGETYNMSMNLSTLITSREPLLEELVREYEIALGTSSSLDSTSNIVLGATNLRSFIYGPWQHYANGPLNILTNPALASSVNAATIYTQKKVFDSVDPLALTYATYYNGKVLYEDVCDSGSPKASSGLMNSTVPNSASNTSVSSYEKDKGVNLTTAYSSLAANRSFSLDVEEGIEESLMEANTSYDNLSEYSEIEVSASDYTKGVLDGWVFNDHAWAEENPDLIHAVTNSVYTAPVQGQVLRDGFSSPGPVASTITPDFDRDSVSYSGHAVSWDSDYFASGTHAGARVPSYSWSQSVTNSYSKTMGPEIDPPRGKLKSWHITDASVRLSSVEIADVRVKPHYEYRANDILVAEYRTDDGYLSREDHTFDWGIRYDIYYTIRTTWNIDYDYTYTYVWHTVNRHADGTSSIEAHFATSSGSDSETLSKADSESLFHSETESENLTVIYHQRPPTGGYTGISTYTDLIEREYRNTTLYTAGAERLDPCCSDAADKYRDAYVDLRAIESAFWAYPDGNYLPQRGVVCDIPPWLHRVMAEEVLAMLNAIEKDNPTFNYSLLESPGQDPTDLQVATAEKLILDLESNREAYVNKKQHLTSSGKMYSSSDSARYIARNEAYNRLLKDIEQKNEKLDSNLNSYILDALEEKGLSTGAFDSVTSGPMTLFDNPAVERAASTLGQKMGIISTMAVTGQPESKYNWTENLTLIIDQKPNYLYHDPDFDLKGEYEWTDSMGGKTIYPLGVRNTCIFTINVSEEIADAISSSGEYVKTETSQQISQSISTLNTEVNLMEQNLSEQGVSLDTARLNTEVNNLNLVYAREMRLRIIEEVAAEVSSNPVVSGWIKEDRVRTVTAGYLNSLSDEELIEKSTTDQLADELTAVIRTEIRNSNPSVGSDELEAVLKRVDTDVRMGVANGICAVTVSKGESLDVIFGKVDGELKNLVNDTVDKYSGEVASKVTKRLDRAMAAVPCGLPVMPPHWIFTVNVWTYEIVGMYQTFTVIDNDNEVIPKPYFGHKGQKYVRQEEHVSHPSRKNEDGSSIWIGKNTQIIFHFSGYSTTIVGPSPKGVGDKTGGSTETSAGYDKLIFELGEET